VQASRSRRSRPPSRRHAVVIEDFTEVRRSTAGCLCRPVSGRPLLLAVLIVVVSTHASAVTTWRGTITTDTGLSGAIRVGRLSSGHDCFGSESGRFWCRGPACPGRRGVFGIDRPDYGRPNPPYTVDVEWIPPKDAVLGAVALRRHRLRVSARH